MEMKVAIVHDSLTQFGGAERIVQALHEIYPDAPVFTLAYDKKLSEHFEGWTIISSPLQHLYNLMPRLQFFLPFIPRALKFFNFSGYDLVISSSSVFAKGIKIPRGVLHINYCHTPARFLWLESETYLREEVPAYLRPILRAYFRRMRKWDYQNAQEVDFFIANSENVRQRIKKIYNRESAVIYPFADTSFFYPNAPKENYFLLAGRMQAHKRADLAITAFNELGLPLHVAGTGRALPKLKSIAKENIGFLESVSDEILRTEYSGAKALVFPQEEDFGIMPLEANACATPVIAYGKGGALETVVDGKTGILFSEQSKESLKNAILRFEKLHFSAEDLFAQAEKFSKEKFKDRLTKFVHECVEKFERQKSAKSTGGTIAVDLRALGPQISGIENYLINILESPAFKDADGIFGMYNSRGEAIAETLNRRDIKMPVSRRHWPNRIFNLCLYFFSLPKFEKFFDKFKIYWMPDLRPYALNAKTKFALTIHDLSPVMHPEFYSLKRRIWHKMVRLGKSLRAASKIFAVSQYTKYDLSRLFKLPSEKIKVIYPGINHDIFKTTIDERLAHKVRERYELPENYILLLSTVEPRKNILNAIKAFEALEENDVHLVIAGKLGWLYSPILKKIRTSAKRNKIKLIGYVAEQDKPFVISMASILCYPSFYEGFGFVPLEAMACGIPVITSARTSLPEICADAAILIEPRSIADLAKAMSELLRDQNLREKMRAKGLERSKQFDWRSTSQKIITELKSGLI